MISSGPGKLHLNYQSYRPIAISHHHDKSLYIKIKHRTNQKIEKKNHTYQYSKQTKGLLWSLLFLSYYRSQNALKRNSRMSEIFKQSPIKMNHHRISKSNTKETGNRSTKSH